MGSSRLTDTPGLRTFASERFRVVLALLLVAVGVGVLVVYPSLLSTAGYEGGHDFFAYLQASERWLDGSSPYTPAQLAGGTQAICLDCYLYPVLLAQLLAPLTWLSPATAELVWYAIQFVAIYAAVWIGLDIGGARRTLERALWALVAVLLFLPVFSSFWYGNVSTVLALGAALVALGGVAAGIGAAAATLLKAVPLVYLPVVFVSGRSARRSLIVAFVVILGISFIIAPTAWLDYPRVLLGMAPETADGLAPATIARQVGAPETVVTAVRYLALGGAVVGLVAATLLAREPRGLPAGALLATVALLLVPGQLWYHYLAVLLPFAAMAWPRASTWSRVGLIAAAAVISASFGSLEWALVGASLMVLVALIVLWPRHRLPGGEPTMLAADER